MKRWIWLIIPLLLVLIWQLGGFRGRTPQDPADDRPSAVHDRSRQVVVTIAQPFEPLGALNPWYAWRPAARSLAGMFYETLLAPGPQLDHWQPRLAETYEWEAGGMQLRFTLRSGLRWSDGTPLTSEDVRFTFEHVLHPDYAGPYQAALRPLLGAAALLDRYEQLRRGGRTGGVEAREAMLAAWLQWRELGAISVPDPQTVVFRFDAPAPAMLAQLGYETGWILPEHVFADVPVEAWTDPNRAPAGEVVSGPYRLALRAPGQELQLAKVASYYLGEPAIDTIVIQYLEQELALGALETGAIDMLGVLGSTVDLADLDLLQAMPHVDVWENPGLTQAVVYMNLEHPLLSRPGVRRALSLLIDRRSLVDEVLHAYGAPLAGPLLPLHLPGALRAGAAPAGTPDDAADLLAAAGLEQREGSWTVQGEPLTLTLHVPQDDPVLIRTARALQQQWLEAGILLRVEPVAFADLLAVLDPRAGGPFELALLSRYAGLTPAQFGQWEARSALNFSRWSADTDPEHYAEAERLWAEVRARIGAAAIPGSVAGGAGDAGGADGSESAFAAAAEALLRVYEDAAPVLFLYAPDHVMFANRRVQGINQDLRGPWFDVHRWRIVPE